MKRHSERYLIDMLRSTGLPYDFRYGKKHIIVYLDGKMIGSYQNHTNGSNDFNGCILAIEKRIKRFIKQ